jgi:hypothetical protein
MDAKLRVLSACSVPSVVCSYTKFQKDHNGRKAPCSQCLLCSLCGLLLHKVSLRITMDAKLRVLSACSVPSVVCYNAKSRKGSQWTQSSLFSVASLFPLWFAITQSFARKGSQWTQSSVFSVPALFPLWFTTQSFAKDCKGIKAPSPFPLWFTLTQSFEKDHNGRKAPCSQRLLCSLCGLLLHKVSKRIAMDAKLRVLSACSVVSVVKPSHHPPLTHRQKSRVQQTFILPLRFNYPPHQRINRTCHN